jgi:hypothetical protein
MQLRTIRRLATVTLFASPLLLLGCGTAAPKKVAKTPKTQKIEPMPLPEKPAESVADAEPEKRELPTACAEDGKICTPPQEFTKRLCQRSTPDLALTMFHKQMPWTRAYVGRDMEAWYTEGRSRPRELKRGEEVLIVAHRSSAGSIQVNGASGSYDVYRWDGTCVSVMANEVTLFGPAQPKVAPINWRRLDDHIRDKLVEDKRIKHRNKARLKNCRSSKANPRLCERAQGGLSRMIAEYVRRGGDVPQPRLIP